LGTGDADGERTESIALLRLEVGADEIRMLNVPCDTLVTRCDGSRGRINAAYAIGERTGVGGMSCVVQTSTSWTGVSIDHAVKVDFLELEQGCNRLDGADSLAFVRARHIDDDYGRTARQQRFVEELRHEVAAQGLITDLPRLLRTANAITRSVEIDTSLDLGQIQQLVRTYRDTLRAPAQGRSIPGTVQDGNDLPFLDVDRAEPRDHIRWLEHGETATSSPDPSPSTPDPHDDAAEDVDADVDSDDEPTESQPPAMQDRCR
jgi:anionic cell wall polymer biosynthesis LytR-Cps2A-Psr (LCP) family protein